METYFLAKTTTYFLGRYPHLKVGVLGSQKFSVALEHCCRSEVGNLHSATPEFVLWLISNCALALSMALSRRSLNAFGAHSNLRFDEFLTRLTAAQLSAPWYHFNEL